MSGFSKTSSPGNQVLSNSVYLTKKTVANPISFVMSLMIWRIFARMLVEEGSAFAGPDVESPLHREHSEREGI